MGASAVEQPEQSSDDSMDALIALGEGTRVEFKSSARWDYRLSAVNRDLTKVIAKSIAGLLNARGGRLLVGVDDDGEVIGIENDLTSTSKGTTDGLQLSLRQVIATHLGAEIGPRLEFSFPIVDSRQICVVECPKHTEPVFYRDGNKQEFYVREGNRTIPLKLSEAYSYICQQWPAQGDSLDTREVAEVLEKYRRALDAQLEAKKDLPTDTSPWLKVVPRRVINAFLQNLSSTHEWRRIFLVSPWISEFGPPAAMSLKGLIARAKRDSATLYVVTRPPEETWHREAIDLLAASGRASVVLVPHLHTKLFTAETKGAEFALMGSANLTQQSMDNHEIGMLINGYGGGRRIIRDLTREAASLYRLPGRTQISKVDFYWKA